MHHVTNNRHGQSAEIVLSEGRKTHFKVKTTQLRAELANKTKQERLNLLLIVSLSHCKGELESPINYKNWCLKKCLSLMRLDMSLTSPGNILYQYINF